MRKSSDGRVGTGNRKQVRVFDVTTIEQPVTFVVNVSCCIENRNACSSRCSWATFVGKYIVADRPML